MLYIVTEVTCGASLLEALQDARLLADKLTNGIQFTWDDRPGNQRIAYIEPGIDPVQRHDELLELWKSNPYHRRNR